jgi:hypothetical protein
MIFYWIAFSVIILCLIIFRLLSMILNRANSKDIFSFDDIKNSLLDMMNHYKIQAVDCMRGKYYNFNRMKKVIIIKEKNEYNNTELFICFHEVGHYIESENKMMRALYILIEIVSVLNLFLLVPVLFIYSTYTIIVGNISDNFLSPLYIVSFILFGIKILSIPIVEARASIIARRFYVCKYGSGKIFIIDYLWVLAFLEQVFMQILFLLPIAFFYILINS